MRRTSLPLVALCAALTLAFVPAEPTMKRNEPIVDLFNVDAIAEDEPLTTGEEPAQAELE